MRTFTVGRLNGRFVVTWFEGDGRRRRFRLAARSLKDAEAEARDIVRREVGRVAGLTVAEIWEEYRKDRRGRSIADSMLHTGKSVLPFFGAFRPDQITTDDCHAYTAERRSAGLQDGTIWSQLGHLRTALSWAVKRSLIERAPYIERPSKPAPKERYLTRPEIDRLLAADCTPHVRLAIVLMLTTAARVGALLELTWDRVDLERNLIFLRKQTDFTRKGRATPPINQTLRRELLKAPEAALSDHVIEWAGRPVASIKKGFAAAVERAGLKDVTPHVLRHTAAVHMAEAGLSMDEIAQYLGHSDTRITASVYARYSPDHLRRGASVLEFGAATKVQ